MSRRSKTRRRFVAALGAATAAALAGCGDAVSGSGRGDGAVEPTSAGTVTVPEATRESYVDVAERGAAAVAAWRARRAETARDLAAAEVVRHGNRAERRDRLAALVANLPADVRDVHLVDRESATVLASSTPSERGERLSQRAAPWLEQELTFGPDGVFVSAAVERSAHSLVSFVGRAGGDGDRLVVVQTDVDVVAGALPVPGKGETTPRSWPREPVRYTAVVDARGYVVGDTLPTTGLDRNDGVLDWYRWRDNPMLRRGLRGESGFVEAPRLAPEATADDLPRYVAAYAGVEGAPWVVVTHVPAAAAD